MNAPKQPRTYCYNDPAKKAQSQAMRRFYNAAKKQLAQHRPGFTIKTHFNPGGIAVWGETYAKVYAHTPMYDGHKGVKLDGAILFPVVEAYDTSMGLLVRQWDGRNSGHNHYIPSHLPLADDLTTFVIMVLELASRPFVRF